MPPPWVLREHVVTITRPRSPAIGITLPPRVAVIGVPWPPRQVTHAPPPPPPRVIRLAAPPQGPWHLPLPPALRYMLAHPQPA
jgi:hypothetical protein